MATITKFEELEVWLLARNFAAAIYQLTLKPAFAHEYKLKEQIKSSSGSVMDNIAEGFGRESRLEFINFLGIAKGSLNETKSQLHRSLDCNFITKEDFEKHYQQAELIAAKLGAFMIYLNKSLIKGQKFKGRAK